MAGETDAAKCACTSYSANGKTSARNSKGKVANGGGERLATLPAQRELGGFAIVPGKDGPGLLVVLAAGVVRAYRCE